MADRHLIFSAQEFQRRWQALQAILTAQGCDCAVLTDAETIFYLTGCGVAPSTYQALVVPSAGAPAYLLRYAEAASVEASSWVTDGRYYNDRDDPITLTAALVRELAPGARRLGLEKASAFLSLARYERLSAALGERDYADLSAAIGWLRLCRSTEEVALHRRACLAIEQGLAAGIGAIRVGVTERDLAEAVATALIRAGADTPRIGVIGSGERLRQVHGGLSDRGLQPGDLIRLEMSNCVNRYWARIMRMIAIGEAPTDALALYTLLRQVQDEQIAQLRPGAIPAELDAFVRRQLPQDRWQMQLSGYALAFHEPAVIGSELERYCFFSGEHRPLAAGMVLHIYLTVDQVSISETVAITATGAERLTTYPRDFITLPVG